MVGGKCSLTAYMGRCDGMKLSKPKFAHRIPGVDLRTSTLDAKSIKVSTSSGYCF